MRTPLSLLATLVLAGGVAGSVAAQDPAASWQPVRDEATGFVGAGVCPMNDPETGGYFCVMLGCEPGGLGYVRFSFAEGHLPDRVVAELRNADASLMREEFYRLSPTGDYEYRAALPAEWGMDVVALLQQGLEGSIVIEAPAEWGGTFEHRFALAGAQAALEPVRACAVRPHPDDPDPLDPADRSQP